MEILYRRLSIRGFLVTDLLPKYDQQFHSEMPELVASGQIKVTAHVWNGLENADVALLETLKGGNVGKSVVVVADSDDDDDDDLKRDDASIVCTTVPASNPNPNPRVPVQRRPVEELPALVGIFEKHHHNPNHTSPRACGLTRTVTGSLDLVTAKTCLPASCDRRPAGTLY